MDLQVWHLDNGFFGRIVKLDNGNSFSLFGVSFGFFRFGFIVVEPVKVIMSIETILRAKVKNWRNICFKSRHAFALSSFSVIIFALGNFYVVLILPFNIDVNNSSTRFGACVLSEVYTTWLQVCYHKLYLECRTWSKSALEPILTFSGLNFLKIIKPAI